MRREFECGFLFVKLNLIRKLANQLSAVECTTVVITSRRYVYLDRCNQNFIQVQAEKTKY